MMDLNLSFDKSIIVKDFLDPNSNTYINSDSGEDRGLYFFFDENEEIIYIGWASYLHERIREHIKGRSLNSKHFASSLYFVA